MILYHLNGSGPLSANGKVLGTVEYKIDVRSDRASGTMSAPPTLIFEAYTCGYGTLVLHTGQEVEIAITGFTPGRPAPFSVNSPITPPS